MKFYTLEELKGGLVVDSEGFAYGYVGGVRYTPSGVELEVRVESGGASDVKGYVPLSEVLGIDVYWHLDRERLKVESRAVLLLSTPREARYRGVSASSKGPLTPDNVIGKLLLTLEGRVLGKVVDIVFGPKTAGLRAERCEGGEIAWLAYVNELKARGLGELASAISESINPYKESRLPLSLLPRVKQLLERVGAPQDAVLMLSRHITASTKRIDISWDSVVKVGDVILARWEQ